MRWKECLNLKFHDILIDIKAGILLINSYSLVIVKKLLLIFDSKSTFLFAHPLFFYFSLLHQKNILKLLVYIGNVGQI